MDAERVCVDYLNGSDVGATAYYDVPAKRPAAFVVVERTGGKVADTAFTDTVCLSLVYREGEEAAFLEAVRERFNAALRPEVGPRRFAEF